MIPCEYQFDFHESVFDKRGKAIEVKGNYYAECNEGAFLVELPCVNAKFELCKGWLYEPVFSFPCRYEEMNEVEAAIMNEGDLSRVEYQKELIRAQNRRMRYF